MNLRITYFQNTLMNGSASGDLDIRTHFSIDNISSDGTILEGATLL